MSRSLMERFDDELVERLSYRGCFVRVERLLPGAEPHTDLVLRSQMNDFKDNITYERSRAERQEAIDEEVRRQLTAEFSVRIRSELLVLPGGRRVRGDTARVDVTARPERFGQDEVWARQEARRKGLRRMVQHAAALVCKGSTRKLTRKVEKARKAHR